jgi:hypothetical protein
VIPISEASHAREPPQQKPATDTRPSAAGMARAYSITARRSPATCSRGSRLMASRAASCEAKSEVRPPPGAIPESRSGAMAMYPSSASRSATVRTQSVRPRFSWTSTTAIALRLTSG